MKHLCSSSQLPFAALLLTLWFATAPATAADPADTVFTGGKVYTVHQQQPWAEAVAVKGNKIVFVGSAEDARSLIGESTEVIDCEGKTVMPGFISGHDHLVGAGWLLAGVKLTNAQNQAELLKLVKNYADANPDAKYILGNGWNFEQIEGRPTAKMLDAIVPDRPVILTDYTCHEAWLNTAALKLGNVTKDTPDILPGTTYWERDEDGNPTGLGLEFQWLPTYIRSGAWQPETGFATSIEMMMGTAVKNGTTTAQVTGIVSPRFTNWEGQKSDFAIAMRILNDMKQKDLLPMRVFPMPIYKDVSATVEDFVGYAVDMSKRYNDDLLRMQSIKIHPEGNWTAHAAPFLEPYLDTGKKGDFGVQPERTKALTLAANRAGLKTVIHTDGDASARAAIDAFEAANEAGFKELRNAIHHLIWVHPDDYRRIVAMDIPINSTPGFGNEFGGQAEQAIAWLGEERVKAEFCKYPDLARDGVKVSISADVLSMPLTSQAPLLQVEAAVTLKEPTYTNSKAFPPGRQGMTVEQAVRAITLDAAYHIHMEDKIGSLEVGKLADIVVLEANPFEVDPMQIEEIDVLLTMVDGKVRHQVDEAEPDTLKPNEPRIRSGDFKVNVGAVIRPADTVALNGKIYTVDNKQPWAEAIAIRGTDIVYVGNDEGAKAFIGKDTKVGDLKGKLVLPGLCSGHEHPLMTAAIMTALSIEYTEDKDKMLQAVADYIREHPDAPPWSWGGSYEGRVEIYREDIDRITKQPFVMVAASGHGAWINSAALEKLGIDKNTKTPVDGVERTSDGTPNGYLSTSAATAYVLSQLDLVKKQDVMKKLPEVVRMYNGYGLTTIHDVGVPPGSEPGIFAAVNELEKRGELNMRISASAMAQRPFHLQRAFEILESEGPKYQSEMFTVNTLKLHGGSPDGYSSPLLEPYSDRPDYAGPEIFPYDVRLDATMKAAKLGYHIHSHVMGDRAIREALDAFEEVRKAGYDQVRLSTGHSNLIHPDDQPRYSTIDVICNTFGSKNASPDPTPFKRLGKERMKYWQPNRTLADMGTRISMSADAPTAPLDPWLQIEVIMLRKEPDQTEQLMPEEGLTLEQAITAYTMGSAYQMGWEQIIGSLEVGKRADLVVVSQNLFDIEPSEIHKTYALLTMVGGRVVHEEAVDWSPSKRLQTEIDLLGSYGKAWETSRKRK